MHVKVILTVILPQSGIIAVKLGKIEYRQLALNVLVLGPEFVLCEREKSRSAVNSFRDSKLGGV
jgi:hypothetical protein